MRKTCLLILLALITSTTWALSSPEYDNRDADFKATDIAGWSTSALILDETIELSDNNRAIVRMSPNAYLFIRSRSGLSETALEATPRTDGSADIRLWIRGNEKRNSDRHQHTIEEIIEQAAYDFGLGAPSEMARIYQDRGVDRALGRLNRIESSSGLAFVIRRFAALKSYTDEEYGEIIKSTHKVKSSSDLAELLVDLSTITPPEPALTRALMDAAREIKSSGDTAYAITEIAAVREIDARSAVSMAEAAATIPSSSDTTFALSVLASKMPIVESAIEAYIEAALSIASSSDKRHALGYIVSSDLSATSEQAYIRAASTISSSSDKAAALTDIVERKTLSAAGSLTYLEAVASIQSSSDATFALMTFIRTQSKAERFPTGLAIRITEVVPYISSSSDKAASLKSLSEHISSEDAIIEAYLDAAKTIPSSSDKEYVVRSLLDLPDLSTSSLQEIQDFVNREISSASSQENLTNQIQKR